MNLMPVVIAAAGLLAPLAVVKLFPRNEQGRFRVAIGIAGTIAAVTLAIFTVQMRYYNHVAYFAIDVGWVVILVPSVLLALGLASIPQGGQTSITGVVAIAIALVSGFAHALALRGSEAWFVQFMSVAQLLGLIPDS